MIVFGISKATNALAQTEMFNFPVLTVMTRPELDRISYRLTFNNEAVMRLRTIYEYTIGESIDDETGEKTQFLIDVSQLPPNVETNIKFKIAYNGNVNNQKLWKHFRKVFDVPTDTFRLKLESKALDNFTVWTLTPLKVEAEEIVESIDQNMQIEEEFFQAERPSTPEESFFEIENNPFLS